MSFASFPSLPEEDEVLAGIHYHAEEVDFPINDVNFITAWIQQVITSQRAQLGSVQYIFCNDNYLHQINLDYLEHDTLTDIITFPYADPPVVSGDIFISTERVADNAADLGLPFGQELHRVIIHGILHLCVHTDKSPEDSLQMRTLEDQALALINIVE